MEIWKEKTTFQVYSKKNANSLKDTILLESQSSSTLRNRTKSNESGLYFVSRRKVWVLRCNVPAYSIRVKFEPAESNHEKIAEVSIKGYYFLPSYQFTSLCFSILFSILTYLALNGDNYFTVPNVILLILTAILVIVITYSSNCTNTDEGLKVLRKILSKNDFLLRIKN